MKKNRARIGAVMLCLSMAGALPMQVLAGSPEFAYSAETWAALRDDKLEFDEIANLVHEYNNTVLQNQITYRDEKDDDADDVAQDYYDRANEIYSNIEYPDSDDSSYGSRVASALSSEQQAEALMEQGDESVDDSETKKWGYDQTEASIVQQAQGLMIDYWTQYYNLSTLEANIETAQRSYETAQNRLAAGMSTQADVLSARESVSNAEASLVSAQSNLATIKESLCQMLGWSYGADVEIGELPEVDAEEIAAIDLDADIQTALENNYSLKVTVKQITNARTTTIKEKLQQTEKSQRESIANSVSNAYTSLLLAQSDYQQASQALELEAVSLAAAERGVQAGTVTAKSLQTQQISYQNAEVTLQREKLALLQAMVDYQWTVDGLASAS